MRSSLRLVACAVALGLTARVSWAQLGHTVVEHEPNDSASAANVITFGDTVTGVIGTSDDWDYFAVDIPANTKVQLIIVRHTFNRMYGIVDPNGVSRGKDGGSDSPDTLNFLTTTAGRHFVYITDYGYGSGADHQYAVRIGAYVAPSPGLGDPVTQVASGLGMVDGMTPGVTGEMFVLDNSGTGGDRLQRIASDGNATVLATGLDVALGAMAVDGFGDLLVSTHDGGGTVWRFSPTGVRTRFNSKPSIAHYALTGIAVGPDGDVWMADPSGPDWSRIWRFDPLGNVRDTIHIDVGRVFQLVFSPAGELHFPVQFGGSVYKLANGRPQLVIESVNPPNPSSSQYNPGWSHLVFDRDGYIYALDNRTDAVVLFDPSYRLIASPFAWVLDLPGWSTARVLGGLAFARDASGSMTTRLLVPRSGEGYRDGAPFTGGGLYELARSAVRAPGWPLGRQGQTVTVSTADVASALLGGDSLTPDVAQYLDSQGNHNGVLDVGDLRAYLRARGQVPPGSHRP